jgi:NAD(P)-dependent dehydrogenase (short-subunit alcohol dehydrogenase family)
MTPPAAGGAKTGMPKKASKGTPAKAASANPAPRKRGSRSPKSPVKKAVPANRSTTAKQGAARAERAKRTSAARSGRLGSPNTGVLITGGGSGIGRETALALAEVGRPVAIWDVNANGAEETATLCHERYGVAAPWSVIDVTDSAAVEAGVPKAATALGSLGGFVHAAGISGAMSVDFIDNALWDSTLNTNVRAAAMISKALLDPFKDAGPGSAVVLISSIEGLFGSAMLTAYCASKGAVLGVMRSISQRFAMEGFRVNAVCPGAVATPMLAPAFEIPGYRQALESRTPLQRVSTPDEIARPIRFLLSDEASFVTGTHLTIDGGLTSVTAI